MSPRTSTTRSLLILVAVGLTASLLSGCSAPSAPDPVDPAGAQASEPSPGNTSTVDADGFPSCDEVKSALAPALDSLVEIDPSENGVKSGSDGPELVCSWLTPETANSSPDLVQYGGLSLGISRDPSYTEESMEPLGWNVQDARVTAAGAWALKVGGGYNAADQLDATGVQVVRDGTVVVLTSGGVVLQDIPQLASLTNEWAMGAGVTLLELMK
jgi:hypothetical protein